MKASKFIGKALIVVGILHVFLGIGMYWEAWSAMAGDYFFNSIMESLDRQNAFWFTNLGVPIIAMGHYINDFAVRNRKAAPGATGLWLAGIGISGLIFVPVSGYWFFIIFAGIYYWDKYLNKNSAQK